jgi:hypothetical protein
MTRRSFLRTAAELLIGFEQDAEEALQASAGTGWRQKLTSASRERGAA